MTMIQTARQLELKLNAAQTPEHNPEAISVVVKEVSDFVKSAKPTTQKQRDMLDRLVELGKIAELGKIGD